jgi:hypothetical protein
MQKKVIEKLLKKDKNSRRKICAKIHEANCWRKTLEGRERK